MTPEQQNTEIATLAGWTKRSSDGTWLLTRGKSEWRLYPHDYVNDFNAMHEAFLTLNDSQRDDFIRHLYGIIDKESGEMLSDFIDSPIEVTSILFCSTAAQRAEAFLKTLNKWKD